MILKQSSSSTHILLLLNNNQVIWIDPIFYHEWNLEKYIFNFNIFFQT